MLTATLHSEALHDGLQVEHLLPVARDELTHFIDDEHQTLTRAPALHQLVGPISELPGTDIRTLLDTFHPGIGNGLDPLFAQGHHLARPAKRKRKQPLVGIPVFRKALTIRALERLQTPLPFERDL